MAGGMYDEGACAVRGIHGGGMCGGGMHGRGNMHGRGHAWQERWPLQRAVRILLECILVFRLFFFCFRAFEVLRDCL